MQWPAKWPLKKERWGPEKARMLHIASAAKPTKRVTADRLLREFLGCVEHMNADEALMHRVSEVVVFGSDLTESSDLGDIDERNRGRDRMESAKERVEVSRAAGGSFPMQGELFWPEMNPATAQAALARAEPPQHARWTCSPAVSSIASHGERGSCQLGCGAGV